MVTDGFRQFASLLRKNVLLKCRRPWATAFEIALPLVLFLLLVYVRVVYETVWYGPFFYRSSVLNPFGLAGELDSKALRDNGAPFKAWKETQRESLWNDASDDGFLSVSQLALGESLCSEELLNTAADRLEAVLSFRGASGVTLAEELLRLDPLAVGKAVTEATETISNFLTDGSAANRGKAVREDFFTSGLDRTTTEVGERLQREIDMLNSLLDAVDGPAQAGRLAEGWYREACATNASALLGTSNETALSDLLWNLGLTLQDTGVASLLRPGMLDLGRLNQIQNLTVFSPNSSLASVISNISQANDDLNFSDLFSQLNGLADAELDRLDLDADQYSSFLDQLQALNDLGLNTVAVEGVLGSMALSSFGLSRTGVSISDISSLLGLLVDGGGFLANLNVLAIALRQIRDLRPIAKTFDGAIWWMSHFLHTSSLTTLILGEVPSSRRSALEGQGFPNGMNPLGPLGMLGDDGGEPGEPGEPFSTEAAFQLLDALQFLQREAVPALLSLEAASVAGLTEGLPLEPALRDIQSFVSRITNTTRGEIETSVVPSLLNGSLSTGICSSQAAPAVGQLIARTHERCPFYRAVVPQLARGSLTSGLQSMLDRFRGFDLDQLDQDMKSLAPILPMTLNETILEVLVRTQADFGYKPRVYERTYWQAYCTDDTDIKTAAECKIAAVQMGKQWAGTVHRTGGHKYCMWGANDKVSFNLATNYSETPPLKPYGSVCHAEKWQNYTKTYELVGAGFCRPEGCDPEDPNCRVNGYYGNGASLLDCRRRCEMEANCIGFSFLPSDGIDQVNSGCFVHTNGSYVPPNWISYAKDYKSIGGASFTSSALCYRVVPTDPTRPKTRGCYFKQSTAGNGRCGGPHTTWVSDDWGRQNEWSWEDEARCFERKTDLDAYCETNTTMLFVHDSANEAFGSPSPRAVAERLTWVATKELLLSFELPRCQTVPFQQRGQGGNARRDRQRRGGGRGNARRLQKQADFIRDNLGSRKILVAPYKGEVKELLDMFTVEALLSAVEAFPACCCSVRWYAA